MPAELSEQIQRFEEKYAENPDSLVFARLADLYRKAGDADRALALLEEGLERHPDYLSAHIVRARCLTDLDREEEAEEAFARVLDHDEQNLVALRGLAELARERGDLEEAERRYEDLLALDPHNEEARSALEALVEGEAAGPRHGTGEDGGDLPDEHGGPVPGEPADSGPRAPPEPESALPEEAAGGEPELPAEEEATDTDPGREEPPPRPAGGTSPSREVAGPDRDDTEAGDDGPWWRTEAPDDPGGPDDPAASGEREGEDEPTGPPGTAATDDSAGRAGTAGAEGGDDTPAPEAPEEPAPAGAGQSDVFSLAGPEEDPGAASGEVAEPGAVPDAGEADGPGDGEGSAPPEGGSVPAGEEAGTPPPDVPGHASREEAEFLGLDEDEGGAPSTPDDAAAGGLPAEEELTERIEEIADTEEGASTEAEADEDLLTETLADLYETQGFYREAVEMYEELLEERPGDDELRARLEAARSAMGEAVDADEPDAAAGGVADDDAGSGVPGDRPAAADVAEPGTADETSSDDGVGADRGGTTTARAHLRALLRGEAEGGGGSVSEGPEASP